jgi:hypothetical protein
MGLNFYDYYDFQPKARAGIKHRNYTDRDSGKLHAVFLDSVVKTLNMKNMKNYI